MTLYRTLITVLAALLAVSCARAEQSTLQFGQPQMQTTQALGGDEPLPEDEAFKVEALAMDTSHLLVRFTMPEGYYLYRDRTQFSLDPAKDTQISPEWPAAVAHHDEHFGPVAVYYGEIDVPLALAEASAEGENVLEVKLQGCKEDSVCYPPMRRRIAF